MFIGRVELRILAFQDKPFVHVDSCHALEEISHDFLPNGLLSITLKDLALIQTTGVPLEKFTSAMEGNASNSTTLSMKLPISGGVSAALSGAVTGSADRTINRPQRNPAESPNSIDFCNIQGDRLKRAGNPLLTKKHIIEIGEGVFDDLT